MLLASFYLLELQFEFQFLKFKFELNCLFIIKGFFFFPSLLLAQPISHSPFLFFSFPHGPKPRPNFLFLARLALPLPSSLSSLSLSPKGGALPPGPSPSRARARLWSSPSSVVRRVAAATLGAHSKDPLCLINSAPAAPRTPFLPVLLPLPSKP